MTATRRQMIQSATRMEIQCIPKGDLEMIINVWGAEGILEYKFPTGKPFVDSVRESFNERFK